VTAGALDHADVVEDERARAAVEAGDPARRHDDRRVELVDQERSLGRLVQVVPRAHPCRDRAVAEVREPRPASGRAVRAERGRGSLAAESDASDRADVDRRAGLEPRAVEPLVLELEPAD
jgi:hypothetical protein